jgi:hypothetical protein
VHICKLEEVMLVSNIWAIFPFSGHVVLASADMFEGGFSNPQGLRARPGAKIQRFNGWGKVLIFALACCLTIMTSGCGAGVSESVGGGLLVSPGTVNFGSVPVGHEADSSINVSNSSSSSIAISQVNISGQTFSVLSGSNMPISIPAGGNYALKIGFTPMSPSSYSGQLTLMDKSAQPIAQVPMQGQGSSQAAPQLTVSAASLSFGSVTVNTATTQSLTLTSTGTSPVTVNSASITGAGFTIVAQSFPATLNPMQSVTLQVQFDPIATGAASGQITINSNSTTGGTALVTLSGTGAPANPQLTVGAASINFNSVAVSTAKILTLTLTSTGMTPVTVNSTAITGAGFTIVGGSFPATLNPTQVLTLQLQFEPTTAGAATGQLTINSNSTTAGTAVVTLTGTGTSVAHEVDLSWNAPTSSSDPVSGYNIYRSTGSGSFVRMNSSSDSSITYVDSAIVSGATYSYVVKSVDSSGAESVASNQLTLTIP